MQHWNCCSGLYAQASSHVSYFTLLQYVLCEFEIWTRPLSLQQLLLLCDTESLCGAHACRHIADMSSESASFCLQVTEQALQSDVASHLSEPLLANLCTMYEILDTSGQDGLDAKRKLQGLLGSFVPDDFDLSMMQAAPA